MVGWQRRRGDNGLFELPAGPAKSYTELGGHNGVFKSNGFTTKGMKGTKDGNGGRRGTGSNGREGFGDALAEWCWHRGVRLEAARAFGMVAEGGVVRAPMFDGRGKITGWQRRRGDNGLFALPAGPAKSYTERGGRNGVFRVEPWPAKGRVYTCEGLPDAVAARTAAPDVAVLGTPGATPGRRALRAAQRLCAEREVVLFPHGDAAGRRWRDAVGGALADAGCRVEYIPPDTGYDLDDILERPRGET